LVRGFKAQAACGQTSRGFRQFEGVTDILIEHHECDLECFVCQSDKRQFECWKFQQEPSIEK
jgi:hypothetical protein